MIDRGFFYARAYAQSIYRQAERMRGNTVEAAHHIRGDVELHRDVFLGLSRDAFETIPEADLAQAERELRHVADLIEGLRLQIEAARAPDKMMEAAE